MPKKFRRSGGGATRRSRRFGDRVRAAAAESLEDRTLLTTILIDYSLDNGFFNTSAKKAAIEAVAREYGDRLTDSLESFGSAARTIRDPKNLDKQITHTFGSPADTVRVFVAGSSLSGNTRGRGGSSTNTGLRPHNTTTDYEPIVGYISFDNDGSTNWVFDRTPDPNGAESDFRAVARHEMMHVLGIHSNSGPWKAQITDGKFTGTKTKAANQGTSPSVAPDGGHFAFGTNSIHQPSSRGFTTLTPLDWAALDDIGWTVTTADDTIGQVTRTLGYGQGLIFNQSIDSPTDVDLYRVLLQKGSTISVSTAENGSDTVDTYLRLFNASGTEVRSNDDDGSDPTYSKMFYTASVSGLYYVGVSSFDNTSYDPRTTSGRTNGSSSNPTGGYRLSYTVNDGDDVGETPDTAKATGLSGSSGSYSRTTTLDGDWDIDLFKFTASAGATLSATTSFPSGGYFEGDTHVRLFNSSGRELISRSGGGGGNYGALQYTFTAGGTYYLGVSHGGSSYGRTYEIVGGVSISGTGGTYGDYRLDLRLGAASGGGVGGESDVTSYGDAYPDLIGRASNGTWWVTENADGLRQTYEAGLWNDGAGWRNVTSADLTGDGLTDVVGRTSAGHWYVGVNTAGKFVTRYFGLWNETAGWTDVRVADFTGDGKADVLGRASNGIWYLSRSTGTAFATSAWGVWSNGAGWRDVLAADFTGDGRVDIAGRTSGGEWYVGRNTGTGFATARWGGWAAGGGWRDVRAGDIDGDGRADVVGRTSAGEWFVARSTGSAFATARWGRWNEAAGWRDVMLGDFGGDSRLDLIGRTSGGEWYVAVTNPMVGFVTSRFGGWNEAAGWQDVMATDFVGGPKADVLARDAAGYWWAGESNGTTLSFRTIGRWSPTAGWRTALAATSMFPPHADGDHDGHDEHGPVDPVFVSYGGGISAAPTIGVSPVAVPSVPTTAAARSAVARPDAAIGIRTTASNDPALPLGSGGDDEPEAAFVPASPQPSSARSVAEAFADGMLLDSLLAGA